MARNYAAVPYEYLEEMEQLTDEEFGRLIRGLLTYSRDGVEITAVGNERFYLKRVMGREEGFQASYEDVCEKRSQAGKKGAQARWGKDYSGQSNGKTGKNGKDKDEVEGKDKDKVYPYPPRGNPRRKGYAPAPPGEMEKCLKKDMDWLKEWSEQMEREGENASNITIDNGVNCG